MKKKICLLIVYIITVTVLFSACSIGANTEYLRIHVRANSNDEIDQNIKYEVKDVVVSFLTPIVAEIKTKEEAERVLCENLSKLKKEIDKFLKEKGFIYTSKVSLKNEKFPTRVYKNLTLEEGFYDALIVELGSGTGDNWWCVIYPPLCFTAENNLIYKSKIYEIINNFFNKRG